MTLIDFAPTRHKIEKLLVEEGWLIKTLKAEVIGKELYYNLKLKKKK